MGYMIWSLPTAQPGWYHCTELIYDMQDIKERSLILIKCQNSFEIFIAYISFVRLNCPVMLVDGNLNDLNYLEVINAYKTDYNNNHFHRNNCKG